MIKLKEIRIRKGLMQKNADILGVVVSAASRIENQINVLSSNQIIKLCKTLDVRYDELLGLE